MKTLLNLIVCGCLVAVVGCSTPSSTTDVNPGMVSECGDDCSTDCTATCDGSMKAAPGAVSATSCTGDASKADCGACPSSGGQASPGAVADSPSCSGTKPACPMSSSGCGSGD